MSRLSRILDFLPVDRLADYTATGGGQALDAARLVEPEALVATVTDAGLRGRGGGGFPTGRKWATIARATATLGTTTAAPGTSAAAASTTTGTLGASTATTGASIPVVVNGAEGEPGTFKDRMLIRHNPFRVLEGALIAARAVGADSVIVLMKSSFTHEIDRMQRAIDEIVAADWIDADAISIITGPGEYLFGEETAMLEVVDGRPPFPRVMAPYRRGVVLDGPGHERPARGRSHDDTSYLDGPVALVDNVETLANVPDIILKGADWFRSVGTTGSPGTIICTVSGDTERAGVGEFAMGTPLSQVISELGGGVGPGAQIAIVLGGVSSRPISAAELNTPITYEEMAAIGGGLGSASFIVISDRTPLGSVAAGVARFLAIESCGQCEACKRDGLAISEGLQHGERPGQPTIADRLSTVARGARCALAGQTERVVGALLEIAGLDSIPSGFEPYPIVPMVDIIENKAELDLAHFRKRADWTFEGEEADSGEWPVHRLADQPVEISRIHEREPDQQSPDIDRTDPAMFAPLHELHDRLEASIDALRRAPADQVHRALATLRQDLERHRRVTERLVYPLVDKLDAAIGPDVTWYPEHHEMHAARLAERLDLGTLAISSQLIDELCADVHVSVIELDLRVIPLLERHLTGDRGDELRLAGDVIEEITDEP